MHNTHACSRTSEQNSHTEFHENGAESLVVDTGSQEDRGKDSP